MRRAAILAILTMTSAALAAADFNGDGRMDVVVASEGAILENA